MRSEGADIAAAVEWQAAIFSQFSVLLSRAISGNSSAEGDC